MTATYFDASAWVKTLIDEPGSSLAIEVLTRSAITATSRLAFVEVEAALAAACRRARLDQLEAARAREMWRDVRSTTRTMALTIGISDLAADLVQAHPLSGADAVHLASALTLGPTALMVTWDRRLALAALAEGLAVVPAPTPTP